jgi:argininosuccinate lyase
VSDPEERDDRPSATLWQGRLPAQPEDVLWRFTADPIDRRLLAVDVEGSIAHVAMLGEVGIVSGDEREAIAAGLQEILGEARSGSFPWLDSDEDVHTAVERRLGEIVGNVAAKLHTGRSRNDQIALDLRLYLRAAAADRIVQIGGLAGVLADAAERNADTIVAAYTHLQQAQAVSLGHHLMAHGWALLRDANRFADCSRRLSVSPLGAGAAGGSALALRPDISAERLGLDDVFENSMDAVASRDLAAEYTFACAQASVTLSRLAEDIVLWASEEFGWATLPDGLATGSSALPQKKNPDIAELVRGRAASVIGDVTTVLALQKGLPLAYNRDLQEDKRAVFHADDVLAGSLEALTALMAAMAFDPPLPGPWVTALDLAEILVGRGVPFRQAHAAVGGLVAGLSAEGRTLADAEASDLTAAHPALTAADVAALDPAMSARRRTSPGGGSPDSVRTQVEAMRGRLQGFGV